VEFVEVADLDAPAPAGLGALRRDIESAGVALTQAAGRDDVALALRLLNQHRLLCAHRSGPYGAARWSMVAERWLAAAVDDYAGEGEWYRGRPLIVTANDYEIGLYNGDTGVVVDGGERGPVAAFARGGDPVVVAPSRLAAVETVHAMTVHRSQGCQFDRVSVIVPPADSPLSTRELLYTAVTRATRLVRVIGTEAAVRASVERPIVRASGLRRPLPAA
jgi:exodeoxyribonuclease V alpha subunit